MFILNSRPSGPPADPSAFGSVTDASHEETGARHEEIDDDEDIEIDFEEDEEEKEEEDPKKEPAKLRKAGSNMFSAVERKAARKKAAQEGGEEVAEERPQKRASGPAGGASRLSPEMQSFLGVQQMSRPQVCAPQAASAPHTPYSLCLLLGPPLARSCMSGMSSTAWPPSACNGRGRLA